jgi:hypothetical protein
LRAAVSDIEATAISYLRLLLRLRVVLLQDVAILIRTGASHIIFNITSFNTEAFDAYSNSLFNYMSTAEDPKDLSLEAVLPGVISKIGNCHADTSGRLSIIEEKVFKI